MRVLNQPARLAGAPRTVRIIGFLACMAALSLLLAGCGGGSTSSSGSSGSNTRALTILTNSLPNNSSLPAATTGVNYDVTLQAAGGTPPYTWSVASGTLPSWAKLDASTGNISGIPDATGQTQLTLKVTDSGSPAASATLSVTLTASASPDDAKLTGIYALASYDFNGDYKSSTDYEGTFNTAVLDGSGVCSDTQILNVAGTISNSSLPCTYSVASNDTMVFTVSGEPGTVTGATDSAGDTLVLSQITAPWNPTILVGVNQEQTGTNADLNGAYMLVSYDSNGEVNNGPASEGNLLTITFDGAGNCSGSGQHNFMSAISTMSVTCTYSVASDGSLTLTSGGQTDNGAVGTGGNVIILSQVTPTLNPTIVVAVKPMQSANDADLTGTYTLVTYDNNGDIGGNPAYEGGLITLDFDGAGNCSGNELHNLAGTVSNESISCTYSVATDGSLSLTTGGQTLNGALGTSGNVIVLSQITPGLNPTVVVGVK
ncbi:MAG: putative Ig domain-containing protein, partial [Gammaproteobacteria bacterium]|nr:putative Ig domain-containing protein [Gammaproteobacteria bacterium]